MVRYSRIVMSGEKIVSLEPWILKRCDAARSAGPHRSPGSYSADFFGHWESADSCRYCASPLNANAFGDLLRIGRTQPTASSKDRVRKGPVGVPVLMLMLRSRAFAIFRSV